jgi:hypothetical protein
MLLGEAFVVLPPSTEGAINSDPTVDPGRSDGDFSVSVRHQGGSRIFLFPDTAFWIEIGHDGPARTRFATYNDPEGTGAIGERGDHDPTAPHAVTWSKSTNVCTSAEWATQTEQWGGGPPGHEWNRDMPIQVHFYVNCGSQHSPVYTCREDSNEDNLVGVEDFLTVLTHWGRGIYCGYPSSLGDLTWDRLVNVDDFLAVLGAWGECSSPIDECFEVALNNNRASWIFLNETKPWTIDGGLDGPMRPPTNDFDDILNGPTDCGWHDYGENGIPGGFRWGDAFGVDAGTGVIGGAVWYRFWSPCDGTVVISTDGDCQPGRVLDPIIEVYAGTCPSDWTMLVACDDSSAAGPCGDHAEIQLEARLNESYFIRVGGKVGERGTGVLSVRPKQFGEPDCNGNGFHDSYDVCNGSSYDCNRNAIPDECETDCNGNGREDSCDLNNNDCDANGVPDECDPDCDGNGIPDACENWFRATSGPLGPVGGAVGVSTLVTDLPEALTDVTFAVYASADLAAPDQAIDLYVDGWFVARFFETTGRDCAAPGQLEELIYERAYFNILHTLDGDNDALLELVPVGPVSQLACLGNSYAQVSLRYSAEPTPAQNGGTQDCNANGIWDFCDVNGGGSFDLDGDGVPDECGP